MSIIKEKRQQMNMSQAKLAQLCGVSQGAVSAWESMDYKPSTAALIAVSEALGLDISTIVQDYANGATHASA